MQEVIFLTVSRSRVEGMTKRLPTVRRGEIPVKVTIRVDEKAFREPVIEKEITIEDWTQGIDIADVEFHGSVITKEEAEMIRQARLAKMKEILEGQGYQIVSPETDESAKAATK
jgi:hypothetical protein